LTMIKCAMSRQTQHPSRDREPTITEVGIDFDDRGLDLVMPIGAHPERVAVALRLGDRLGIGLAARGLEEALRLFPREVLELDEAGTL